MESKIFINGLIAEKFGSEYVSEYVRNRTPYFWVEFIETKDLGIIHLPAYGSMHTYKIIDEKKWLLSKLKYNF